MGFLPSRDLRILGTVCLHFRCYYVGVPVDTRLILHLLQLPAEKFNVWSFLTSAEACRLASVTFNVLEWSHIQTRGISGCKFLNLPSCVESDPE